MQGLCIIHLKEVVERKYNIWWSYLNEICIFIGKMNDTSEVVHDIFWTHSDAVKMINAFNIMFLMDNTYKTNIYRLPIIEASFMMNQDWFKEFWW